MDLTLIRGLLCLSHFNHTRLSIIILNNHVFAAEAMQAPMRQESAAKAVLVLSISQENNRTSEKGGFK